MQCGRGQRYNCVFMQCDRIFGIFMSSEPASTPRNQQKDEWTSLEAQVMSFSCSCNGFWAPRETHVLQGRGQDPFQVFFTDNMYTLYNKLGKYWNLIFRSVDNNKIYNTDYRYMNTYKGDYKPLIQILCCYEFLSIIIILFK